MLPGNVRFLSRHDWEKHFKPKAVVLSGFATHFLYFSPAFPHFHSGNRTEGGVKESPIRAFRTIVVQAQNGFLVQTAWEQFEHLNGVQNYFAFSQFQPFFSRSLFLSVMHGSHAILHTLPNHTQILLSAAAGTFT